LSAEKKELIARSKKLIRLIKSGDPPKNYVERRANKLREEPDDRNIDSNKNVHGFHGTTIKEYDEYAKFDLEEFIEDISTNNACGNSSLQYMWLFRYSYMLGVCKTTIC
jgi:hypothetical protein